MTPKQEIAALMRCGVSGLEAEERVLVRFVDYCEEQKKRRNSKCADALFGDCQSCYKKWLVTNQEGKPWKKS